MSFWSILLPEAGTNLVPDPSFERGTGSWAAQGTNTIAQSSAQAFKGAYSALCTYQNTATAGWTRPITLSISTTYHLSCWVYVSANWDGGNIKISSRDYGGSSETVNYQYTHGTSPTATWIYLETKLVIAADAAGSIAITLSSAPTAGRTFYLDAVQVEANASYATTYIDGDQPGCKWNGAVHDSTSTRSAQERSAGQVVDLADYGFNVSEMGGFGMAPQIHSFQANAFLDGAVLENTKTGVRSLLLTGDVEGASYGAYHSKRKDIINLVKSSAVAKKNGRPQPFILRYTGANTSKPVQIACYYDDGLGLEGPRVFSEVVVMRLLAADPFWYEIGNGTAALTTSVSETHSYLSRRVDGNWENLGGTGLVTSLAIDSQYVYVGGAFLNWGAVAAADNIASYNKAAGTWGAVGGGLDSTVRCMIVGPDGALYVGGQFTTAGVANTDGIAKWDGSNWTALGTGVSGGTGYVYALAFDQSGNLYATGDFTQMGGVANTAYIAMWNGSAWSAVSTGLGGVGRALAVDQIGDLYIGGEFTNLGDVNGDYIVKWNGSAFSSLGTGMNNTVYALVVGNDNSLYAIGLFTTANGVTVNRIARWNGTTFKALETGLSGGDGYFMSFIDGLLYASGSFTTAGSLTVDQAAIWNGSTWAHLDINLPGSPAVWSTVKDPYTDYLYLGYSTTGTTLTSAVNTITNNGTARAHPKVVIKCTSGTTNQPATVAYLKNKTTGATLWLNYPLFIGETLTLDFTLGARSISSSMFGTVWRAILKQSDFSQFYLLPGSNDVILFVNETSSTTLTAYITFPLTHESADGVAD